MANLATATAADRTTVSTLTATVSQLTSDLAAINAHLVTALATNATLTSTIAQMGGRGRGSGRGRGGDEDEDQKSPHLLQPRVWEARQDGFTAGRAAHSATTVAQGVGLKKTDTRMRH